MAQDIKKLLENVKDNEMHTMPEGHDKRFAKKLNNQFHQHRKSSYPFIKIAATIIILLGIGYLSYQMLLPVKVNTLNSEGEQSAKTITLGDISPDLKKIENYYVTHINIELLKLNVDDKNKQLFRNYMMRLTDLNDEYQELNQELNKVGPNEQTINALIGNLQLRLQLLYKLKEKLNELKTVNHESSIDQQV